MGAVFLQYAISVSSNDIYCQLSAKA